MRLVPILVLFQVASCAAGAGDDLSGRQSKNGLPLSVEVVGAFTDVALPAEKQRRKKQVRLYNSDAGHSACRRVYVQDATEIVRRIVRQLQNQATQNLWQTPPILFCPCYTVLPRNWR